MKILHYCAHIRLETGGVVRSVIDLTEGLSKAGKDVTLLATEGEDWPSHHSGVRALRSGPFDRVPIRFSRERLNFIREHIEHTDVLHLHTPWEPANMQLAKIAKSFGIPYIVSIHGMLDDWSMSQRNLKKRLYLLCGGRSFLQKSAAIHCTAEAELTQVAKWTPRGRHVVIPYVFNPSEYLNPPPTSDPDKYWPQREKKRPVVLFLSRIHEKKGIEKLLEAAAVIDITHDVRFIIAGSGDSEYEQRLHTLVSKLNIEHCVEFVGFVTGDRKTALYRATDIFALPTSQENFGIVLHEAMTCGIPVITTKGVDIWHELYQSGGATIIDDSKEQLVSALTTLLQDTSLQTTMGNAGRSWIEDTFDGDAVVNRFISMYRNAMTQ